VGYGVGETNAGGEVIVADAAPGSGAAPPSAADVCAVSAWVGVGVGVGMGIGLDAESNHPRTSWALDRPASERAKLRVKREGAMAGIVGLLYCINYRDENRLPSRLLRREELDVRKAVSEREKDGVRLLVYGSGPQGKA